MSILRADFLYKSFFSQTFPGLLLAFGCLQFGFEFFGAKACEMLVKSTIGDNFENENASLKTTYIILNSLPQLAKNVVVLFHNLDN